MLCNRGSHCNEKSTHPPQLERSCRSPLASNKDPARPKIILLFFFFKSKLSLSFPSEICPGMTHTELRAADVQTPELKGSRGASVQIRGSASSPLADQTQPYCTRQPRALGLRVAQESQPSPLPHRRKQEVRYQKLLINHGRGS